MDVIDLPVLTVSRNGKAKSHINAVALAEALSLNGDILMVGIEQVSAMPGQGATSMFSFGRSLGVLEGVTAAMRLPILPSCSPVTWKKAMKVTADKDSSRHRATQLMPMCAGKWNLKKHDGRAEAALIAYYTMQQMGHILSAPITPATIFSV